MVYQLYSQSSQAEWESLQGREAFYLIREGEVVSPHTLATPGSTSPEAVSDLKVQMGSSLPPSFGISNDQEVYL